MRSATDIRRTVTEQIITALQNDGLPPWRRPYSLDVNCGSPLSLSTTKPYRGINTLILALSAMKNGYQSRWWGSYQAIKQAGGYVRRGEKATAIVLFRPITKTTTKDTGEEEEEKFCVMRCFQIFNVEQANGLGHLHAGRTELAPAVLDERYEKADALIAAARVPLSFGGNTAAYSPTRDQIVMPFRHQFATIGDYYETLFHEHIHACEHPSRLNWNRSTVNNAYAFFELVAEIGACFLCTELGLPSASSLENHHSYLKSWIAALENDPKFIFQASAWAAKAVDYLMAFSHQQQPEPVLAG